MRVVITGGTGLIGRRLAGSLAADGYEVFLLSRSPGNAVNLPAGVRAVYWDARTPEGWGELVEGAAAVVNLAGENLAGDSLLTVRWTPARRRRIYESRLNAGQAVVEAVRAAGERPAVVIQSSGVNYYGIRHGDTPVAEDTGPGNDFLARLCVEWEDSTAPVERLGVRRAVIRTALVLSTRGGALPRLMLPFRFFAGGPIGSGQQWYSWIHIDDEIAAIRFLIKHEEAAGAFNLAAPNPVTNAAFARALGRAMHRPSFLPVPAFVFRLAFGEASTVLLEGQRAVPRHLLDIGFAFQHTEIEAALRDVLANRR